MQIFLAIVLFAVGAFVVAKGADLFVDASSWVSDVSGISKALIGATIVAVATSGPELFVSIFASAQGQAEMSTGNIIGSHLCNLGIGFALIATFKPGKNSDKLYMPSSLFTLLTASLLFLFYFLGTIGYVEAIILLVIYAIFTFINIRLSDSNSVSEKCLMQAGQATALKLDNAQACGSVQACDGALDACSNTYDSDVSIDSVEGTNSDHFIAGNIELTDVSNCSLAKKTKPARYRKPTNRREIIINIIKFVVGLVGIILGSKLIVDNATILAKAMGISEMIIGLTIVAIGTSLPEIVTTIAALIKKESDLGIGNIFGSCVFNNAFIIAITAFIVGGLSFTSSVLIDLPVAIAMTLITLLPTLIGKKIYRFQGIALASIYFSYLTYLVIAA